MSEYPYGMIVAAVLGIISVFVLAREPSAPTSMEAAVTPPAAVTYVAPAVVNPIPGQFPVQAGAVAPPPVAMNQPQGGAATAVPMVPFPPQHFVPGVQPYVPGPHN